MVRFDCPSCGKSISVEDDAAGGKRECPACGETVQVPQRAAEESKAESSSADAPVPAEIVPDAPSPAIPVSQSTGKGGAGIVLIVIAVVAVVVLLGVVGLFLVGSFIGQMQTGAYVDLAKTQMGIFESQLGAYRLHVGSLPNTNQGLVALRYPPSDLPNPQKWRGPYCAKDIPADPWDNPYQYEMISPGQYRIWSWGADGIDGTDDDLIVTNVPLE
ncbi:MAG: type II secretion system major pseudopilin GspG [Planctomycetes bacterium]|nr:type II secretion system major pseudopilin GspG [Planctomycetota bacterium]MBL7040967.1 type II secretion system major pseudopilin GspG [Pirellulaceae bacterium]